jgi:heme o synthase
MSSLAPFSPAVAVSRASSVAHYTRDVLRDYAQLFKARVTAMILLTAWSGAYLASRTEAASPSAGTWAAALAIGLVAAGTAAMNEVLEYDVDAKMRRTAMRPLVTGRISRAYAAATASIMIAAGVAYLALTFNLLTAALAGCTSVLYLCVYTPLKKVTPICTTIGAIPGAMPAVLGWTAVRGRIGIEAIVLFAIVFFWQFPHFHAIALLYREDYARAGIRMLPVVEPDANSTINSILLHTLALAVVSFTPAMIGKEGIAYLIVSFTLSGALLFVGWHLRCKHAFDAASDIRRDAQRLLAATVLYLPALFAAMLIDSRM